MANHVQSDPIHSYAWESEDWLFPTDPGKVVCIPQQYGLLDRCQFVPVEQDCGFKVHRPRVGVTLLSEKKTVEL